MKFVDSWIRLYGDGYSIVAIAKMYNCSTGPVTSVIKSNTQIRDIATNSLFDFLGRFQNSNNGCIEWLGSKNNKGYGQFKYNGKVWLTHILSYTLSYGPPPPGLDLCHKCDNPICGNPDHLKIGSRSDNIKDMLKKGRGATRLNPISVRQLIHLGKIEGMATRDLAKKFNISTSTVRDAINGRTWSFLNELDPPPII